MSADPDVFRYSLRRVYRTQVRRMLFGVVPFAFVVATGILGLIFDHTASQRHFYRLDLALGALLARSALRVEGDWSDRMMLTSLRKELPLAAAARLSSRMKLLVAVALMGEVVLIAGTGFMAFRLAQ
jgi:hypothetical protein